MARLMLSDERWSKLRKIMRQHGIYDKPNLRRMVEGMLYRIRVGCPWLVILPRFVGYLAKGVNSLKQKSCVRIH